MRSTARVLLTALALSSAACSDVPTAAPTAPSPARNVASDGSSSEGRGVFHRYVAIGTSISMGVQSDGVHSGTQRTSWPAQLARLAHRELSLPLIAYPGCAAPLDTRLSTGLRLSGEAAGLPFLSRQCAPNEPGVTLPAGNVAIDGARTIHALVATPEHPDPSHAPQYARVLPPGMSQVSAMEAQDPKIVSVELGGNDVLGASSGIFLPGVSVVQVPVWAAEYRQVVERVDAATKHAVLVGLVNDVRSFPSFRTGDELWDARATFAPFNVRVSENCENSENLMFVAVRVPVAAATGAAYARAGIGPFTLSCANAPSSSLVADYVLGPDDVAALNAQLAAMNAIIAGEAEARGFAYFPLAALYEDANVKAPFNAVALMTSTQPYGPLISLDGLHPTAAGSAVLAGAAARALNATYHFGIPTSGATADLVASLARR
jgi:lysophospholipase L1-like esterase